MTPAPAFDCAQCGRPLPASNRCRPTRKPGGTSGRAENHYHHGNGTRGVTNRRDRFQAGAGPAPGRRRALTRGGAVVAAKIAAACRCAQEIFELLLDPTV
jgi:hypothetical protein